MIKKIICSLGIIFTLLSIMRFDVYAGGHTDEILKYHITADVNEDATVDLTYDISWLVLESDEAGPVSWLHIGIPNNHYLGYEEITDNIEYIDFVNSSGSYANVYLYDKYYEGDIIDVSFKVTMDYMYLMDNENEITTYTFTPGWFDDIDVDDLTIKWNTDKVDSFSPACINNGDYYEWNTYLSAGDRYTVNITYPIDAYDFIEYEYSDEEDEYDPSEHSFIYNIPFYIGCIFGIVIFLGIPVAFIAVIALAATGVYSAFTGFGAGSTKKITRTKIEYYESCPGCGGNRAEGKETCAYCGKNMVKSKEEITEEEIPKEEETLKSYNTKGEYKYSHSPNTYLRVNVVSVPHVTHTTSSHHSSCAHSSCACACACAGGGRAGCSTKDFYKTNLKLRYFERMKNGRKTYKS